MMKMPLTAAVGLLAAFLPSSTQAVPKSAAAPQHILVTLQVMEVPSRVAQDSALKPYPSSGTYDALLKESSGVTEVSVQTPKDFPGVARYSRIVTFPTQENGKPGRGFLTAPTSLEATPHINTDGTITVDLKMEMTRFVPADPGAGGVPATTSQSMTTRRTFKSGETLLFGGTTLTAQADKPGASPETKELLQFITVTVLPSEVAAR